MSSGADPTIAAPVSEVIDSVPEAVLHLKSAVKGGAPWYQALLEAIGLWTLPQEVYQGRTYQYLLHGEALDWLLLAERLCTEFDSDVDLKEMEQLLFFGRFPLEVSREMFRDLVGSNKHRAFLNYWYGVVVEEALQLAVEEEVRKRHRARCYPDSEDLVEDAFIHLYNSPRAALLEEFRARPQGPLNQDLSLTDVKEFTYWLFKSRLKLWDPARVASDTRKGIRKLRALESIEDPELRRAEIYGILIEGSLPTDYPTKTTRYSGKR